MMEDGRKYLELKTQMMFKHFEGGEDGTKINNYHSDYGYYYTVGTKINMGMRRVDIISIPFP